jgi:hypothetical protein
MIPHILLGLAVGALSGAIYTFARKMIEDDPMGISDEEATTSANVCRRCGTWRRGTEGALELLVEDAYGSLHRCPKCGRLWYYDVEDHCREATREWSERMWPDLKI